MGKIFIIIILFISLFNFKVKATINCGQLTEKIEKEYKIPNKLLTSISLVESGIKKENEFHYASFVVILHKDVDSIKLNLKPNRGQKVK